MHPFPTRGRWIVSSAGPVRRATLAGLALLLGILVPGGVWGAGEVEVSVVDRGTGEPQGARMELLGPHGRPIIPRGHPAWQGEFALDGKVRLQLPGGISRFTIQRGYEYRRIDGHFEVGRDAEDSKLITLHRFVDMPGEGWWSADLDVRRPVRDMPMLLVAEDLHVAWMTGDAADRRPPLSPSGSPDPGSAWRPVGRIRGYDLGVWRAPAGCGGLVVAHPSAPLDLADLEAHASGAIPLAQAAHQQNAYVAAMVPYDWDFPTLVALQLIDGVGILNHHLHTGGQSADAGGYLPDRIRYPAPRGLGRWAQHIYFQLLEAGVRLPPLAGSGSGVGPGQLGENRVYVQAGPEFSYAAWWEGLEAGRVMVTNGPLLRVTVDGRPPGHIFRGEPGQTLDLQPALNLSTRFPVEYLEVIQNGRVIHEVRLDDLASRQGRLPAVAFSESGWMAVRAVTVEGGFYQYALSGPYYVQIGSQRRVSRRAAQFFLDWVYERARRIHAAAKPEERADRLEPHRQARDYWRRLVEQATVE